MIALIPALFLIISGFGVILLSRLRKGLGFPWLISAVSALLAWTGILVIHWFPSNPLYVIGWNPTESFTHLIGFQLDLISWPYSFAIVTLTMAVLFTSSARIESTVPLIWGLSLVFGGLALLAIMAATPLTIILTWSLIDLGELIVLQGTIRQSKRMRPVVISYTVQLVSILLVSLGMIFSRSDGHVLDVSQITYPAGIILFLGVVLRLGVFPRHLPYPGDFRFRRELGTLLRGVQPATGLVLLARMPDLDLPGNWLFLLKVFITIAALYGSVRWMTSANEVEARPYWVIGVAGLAMLSVLNGSQITSMIWGLILILIGGVAGLYSSRDVKIQYIPLLTILSLLGLPFTPAAGGWTGLVNTPFSLFTICYFLIHLLMVLGLIRHLFRKGDSYIHLERWIRVIYPAGLLILVIAHWIIATWGWPGSYSAGVWWASLVPLVIIGVGYYIREYTNVFSRNEELFLRWQFRLRKYFFDPLAALLRGRWLMMLLQTLFELIGRLVRSLSRLLEGEGGFLWVILLLAMLVTFVMSAGAG